MIATRETPMGFTFSVTGCLQQSLPSNPAGGPVHYGYFTWHLGEGMNASGIYEDCYYCLY
jgi:hypothetical protein